MAQFDIIFKSDNLEYTLVNLISVICQINKNFKDEVRPPLNLCLLPSEIPYGYWDSHYKVKNTKLLCTIHSYVGNPHLKKHINNFETWILLHNYLKSLYSISKFTQKEIKYKNNQSDILYSLAYGYRIKNGIIYVFQYLENYGK